MESINSIAKTRREYSIEDLMRLFENEELKIQPKYQRRRTPWPITAKTSLLDTIIRNYPIQEIFIREFYDDNNKRIREIFDGQQRISTILEFINDGFELGKNLTLDEYEGYKFSELPENLQQEIKDYELSFLIFNNLQESDIVSIFSRINSFTLPLNSQEKRNAEYAGELKALVYILSSNYLQFWINFRVLNDNSIARMGEAQFISEIIATIILGYENYSGNKSIDDLYRLNDQSFPMNHFMHDSFDEIMTIIGSTFEDEEIKSHYNKKTWLFTLFMVLYEYSYGKPGQINGNEKKKKINIRKLQTGLKQIAKNYLEAGEINEIKNLFVQGTGTSQNRKRRHEYLLMNLKKVNAL